MKDFNKVAISGRLTDKPVMSSIKDTYKTEFTLAVNGFKDNDTSFVDMIAWGKTAEFCKNYCDKGTKIIVSGRLQQDRWEYQGKKYSKMVVVVEEVTFAEALAKSLQNNNPSEYKEDKEPEPPRVYERQNNSADINDDDELPF